MLQRSEVDFIIMDYKWERSGVETHLLGYEEFVVIESSEFKNRNDIFLDNDPQDRVTSDFFRKQKHKISYRRSYMDDAYGILDGAAQGLGRAVMSRHLVSNTAGIRIVPGFSPWKLNVVLHYYSQPFYPKLQGAVVSELVSKCPKWLGDK